MNPGDWDIFDWCHKHCQLKQSWPPHVYIGSLGNAHFRLNLNTRVAFVLPHHGDRKRHFAAKLSSFLTLLDQIRFEH